jgi:hypothetical protein
VIEDPPRCECCNDDNELELTWTQYGWYCAEAECLRHLAETKRIDAEEEPMRRMNLD